MESRKKNKRNRMKSLRKIKICLKIRRKIIIHRLRLKTLIQRELKMSSRTCKRWLCKSRGNQDIKRKEVKKVL